MTEHSLVEALAHAEKLRKWFAQSSARGDVLGKYFVLLADEVIRLHAENEGLKGGKYNTAIALKSDLRGGNGE